MVVSASEPVGPVTVTSTPGQRGFVPTASAAGGDRREDAAHTWECDPLRAWHSVSIDKTGRRAARSRPPPPPALAGTTGGQDARPPSPEAPLVQDSHTQPYSYHTVCGSPPGSGDAGVLFELFPRPKCSGARPAWGAKSGDLPRLLAGSPSLWPCPGAASPSERLSPPWTGVTVATSPECCGVWGLVLAAGAAAGEKCWSWELPPPPVAMAGAVADCCRGASLSSFGGASEKRLVSSGRLRGPRP